MGKQKKNIIDPSTGITILIGIVILGGLGWMASEINSVNKVLSSVKTLSEENKDRMNRIGQNIPQIKTILAHTEMENKIEYAVVAYQLDIPLYSAPLIRQSTPVIPAKHTAYSGIVYHLFR